MNNVASTYTNYSLAGVGMKESLRETAGSANQIRHTDPAPHADASMEQALDKQPKARRPGLLTGSPPSRFANYADKRAGAISKPSHCN